MVICHAGYFFKIAAFSWSTLWPLESTSDWSRPKNNGFSGESRFRSSSERPAIESSATGSGGTTTGSLTGCGGGGGLLSVVVVKSGGGGIGRATGAAFFAHALIVIVSSTAITVHFFASRLISTLESTDHQI